MPGRDLSVAPEIEISLPVNLNVGLLAGADEASTSIAALPAITTTITSSRAENQRLTAQSDMGRILSLGGVSLLMAVHYIGNGIILTSYGGQSEQAAVSLITSIQSVASGIVFGALLNTGVEMGPFMVTGDDIGVGSIIKISWIVGLGLGLGSMICLVALNSVLPRIVAQSTANVVSSFFSMYELGGPIFEPLVASNGIVLSLIDKDWLAPLVTMAIFRLSGLGLGYFLAVERKMGAAGLGLGISIAGASTILGFHLWFAREKYRKYGLYTSTFPNFRKRFLSYLGGAWKLSLQRISEWGNLAILSLGIGAVDDLALQATTPFSQANLLIGFGLQGMAGGAMVFIGRDAAAQRRHNADLAFVSLSFMVTYNE